VLVAAGGVPVWFTLVSTTLYFAAMEFALLEQIAVRSVNIEEAGVTFTYFAHSESVPWSNLSPRSEDPIEAGMFWLYRPKEYILLGPGRRSYAVTRPQIRAILQNPACPRWPLTPEVRTAISSGPSL
jgi:hypothetical protein